MSLHRKDKYTLYSTLVRIMKMGKYGRWHVFCEYHHLSISYNLQYKNIYCTLNTE
jgi:hypothetical protein